MHFLHMISSKYYLLACFTGIGLSTRYDRMKYFINQVSKIGSEEGLSLGAWEDAVISHDMSRDQEIGVPFPRTAFQNKYVI